ncbi:MAG: TIGR04013 family B12-binding domain/radical SAM domain-containing protein [Candidatus Omnitrophota bacterium]
MARSTSRPAEIQVNKINILKHFKRIIFRLSPCSRLSFPVLLNAWEQEGIDREFDIIIRETPLGAEEVCSGDVILFSFMTSLLPEVHREVLTIRQSGKKGVILIGGGPHITGEQRLSRQLGFDALVIGSGERSFVQLGKDLLENRGLADTYLQPDAPEWVNDFKRHLPVSTYIENIPPLEVMRGCYWNCRYCSTHWYEAQSRSLDSVKDYLDAVHGRGFKRVNFISPSSMEYGATRPRQVHIPAIENLLALARSYPFRFVEYGIFPSEVRPDTVTPEGMAVLKKYVSNRYVTMGAQSGSNERLKELRRGHTVEDIDRAIEIANAAGFSAHLDFIIGYPDETPDERRVTIDYIKTINKKYRARTHLHYFIPLSGSPYEFRLPSFLSPSEKENLYHLRKAGIVVDGWVSNETQVNDYLQWLAHHFPDHHSLYH